MQRRPHVVVHLPHEQTFARALLVGIGRYASAHGGWEFTVPGLRGWPAQSPPGGWKGDGAILQVRSVEEGLRAQSLGMPFVNLTALAAFPTVTNDNQAIARLAAEHFRERGYRRFGFFDLDRTIYAQQRASAFAAAVSEAGFECQVCDVQRQATENHDVLTSHAQTFLRTLTFPAAVFAANDVRARALLDAARQLGIAVPAQLSILGVDDEIFCEFTTPPLSTILPDGQRAGYQAAAMLDRLMRGIRPDPMIETVPPRGVILRGSTNVLAVEDDVVAEALRFIRENGNRPLEVREVLGCVPASRRTLERRFRAAMGYPPAVEIRRAQIRHVQRLLVETDWLIERIARNSAFHSLKNLGRIFRDETGMTPGEYRALHRTPE